MTTTTARRPDAGLLSMAVVLVAAYFVAPRLLLGPGRPGDFPRAFAAFWSSGGADLPPELQHLVDYQFHYHLARVIIALPLLAVLVTLTVRLRRFRLAAGVLALAAAVLLIANVQGVVSPFGTLLPILASGSAAADSAALLAQVRDQLHNGATSPAVAVMLGEYVRWHVAKGVLVGLLAVVLAGLSAVAWRRRRRWLSLLAATLTVAALVVVAANVTTVADPVPPFLLLLQGSR
ncbi:hypothetical protein [Actinoplanes sp. N902-109]|uniref:hypothetical protein n=1 Tax=Actinoplanes sp. (strain N902-109) TaxID=649831 RepID=UPI0003293E13|nr:hypothetical protein [Actinoplanes sp. N902-109]AGL16358.1 hypothetical protein L083_2848 [Actinoplanes sp. N902-109]